MKSASGRARRWRKPAAIFAVVALIQLGLQLTTATPAAAKLGLAKATAVSATDSVSPKIVTARCTGGRIAVGGGAAAVPGTFAGLDRLMLTALAPFHDSSGGGFTAMAFERQPGLADSWSLYAYALCADPGYDPEIVSTTTNPSSARFQATAAGPCPDGKRVLGTGSQVSYTGGAVGLQLNRSDGPMTISRSTAREDSAGYAGSWSLTSYAVCARPAGQVTPAPGTLVSGTTVGDFTCPLTPVPRHGYVPTYVTGVNGGGPLTDTAGATFLRVLHPEDTLRGVEVAMTSPPAGGMVVGAICSP